MSKLVLDVQSAAILLRNFTAFTQVERSNGQFTATDPRTGMSFGIGTLNGDIHVVIPGRFSVDANLAITRDELGVEFSLSPIPSRHA